ncbi:MAG: sialate O-acetylesterase [Chitinophagaceae bacterium]|nr:sialate O-acetylesterase [Chitinophagaceae bacterium]
MNMLFLNISSQNKWHFIWLFILAFFPVPCFSQLQLAKIFSDNMVLQRNEPVNIWGKAKPGDTVIVVFANDRKSTVVQHDSGWTLTFKAQQASIYPQSALIRTREEKIEISNILMGDLWLCIGQSNMEWPMFKEKHFKEEMNYSNQPLLRLYNPVYAGKNTFNVLFSDSIARRLTAEKFYSGHWQTCDSSSFKTMSAVAYYFGKEILNETGIPVGLINFSIGGAPLETFIGTDVLGSNKQFSYKVHGDWLENDALPVWVRERGKQNVGSLKNVPNNVYGNNHAFKPGFAFEAGIVPILNLPIKGIVCYQGESNAQEIERVNEYGALSKMMVDDYRKKLKNPDLPFYYVQLSSIDTVKYKGHLWPQFRDEQRKMLQLIPHSGMAVCSDIGAKNDVHPTNKKTVGERLARWALNKTYHKKIVPSGPLPLVVKYRKGKVIVSFLYEANGLRTTDGKPLKGFSFDGKNEVEAVFENKAVKISTNQKPEYVYYGWTPFSNGNLVNTENLPASTFKIKVQ